LIRGLSTGVQGELDKQSTTPVGAGGRVPVSWPRRVGVVPGQAECFQRRGAADVLDAAIAAGGTAVLCQVLAGTGGVGKTQLAAAYARAEWQAGSVELLAWITAGSRDAVVAAYAQAGEEVAGADPGDPELAAGRFLSWLETTERRWLVVLDDLADPADLRRLWPPASSRGRVLVTTRRRDAVLTGEGRKLVDIELFTSEEAAAYLTANLAAHERDDRADEIAGLAADLGFLPLALAQAAAYLTDLGLDCASYRRRLADRRHRLPDLVPDNSGLPDDHRAALAATWSLSIEQADRLRPAGLARPVLELASMLDPNGIPQSVLTSPPARAYLTQHRTRSTDSAVESGMPDTGGQVDAGAAADALRCLSRLSLAELDAGAPHRPVRVHNLIQRATRESLPEDRGGPLARAAADALLAAWPDIERDTALSQALRSSTGVLVGHAGAELWHDGAHPVLFRAGASLGGAGLLKAAIAYWQDLHAAAVRYLGRDHPDTLTTRGNLAHWRGKAGDPAGAAAAFEELVADLLRVLGPDHLGTLVARSGLARWRGEAGDPVGAAAAFEELVADELRVLGPDHPDTLITRGNLGHWRGKAGDPAAAVAAYEQLLADSLRVLGPDHPNTFTTRSRLAHWRGQAGNPAAAGAAFEELLADELRVLGPDHPDTLRARRALAYWRGEAGDPAGAATAYQAVLADQLRVLGPDHPDTLDARHSMAYWRGKAGDPAEAAAAFEEVLADSLRVLGPDHPDTLVARRALARWRGEAGGPAGAVAAFEELLADSLRVLGPDHPDTLVARRVLARWRGEAGDPAGAAAASAEALADCLRVLGPDHPGTLSARGGLAYWQGRAGDAAAAAAAFEELLTDSSRVLGPDHPDTLGARHGLAYWRGEAGDAASAAAAFEELLTDCLRVLGPDHSHTTGARRQITYWTEQATSGPGPRAD
jgi:hypothetical protein